MSYARCPPDEGRLPGRPRSRVARDRGGARFPVYLSLLGAVTGPRPAGFWSGSCQCARPRPGTRVEIGLAGRSAGPGASLRPRPRAAVPRRNAGGCEGRRPLGPGAGPRAGRWRGGRAQPATQIAGRLPAEGGPAAAWPSSSAIGRLGGCTQKLPSCGKRPATGRGQWSLAPNSAAH